MSPGIINPFLLGYHANSADPLQMRQKVASNQGQHCLLTGFSMQNTIKYKHPPQMPNELEMDSSK